MLWRPYEVILLGTGVLLWSWRAWELAFRCGKSSFWVLASSYRQRWPMDWGLDAQAAS